MAGRPLVLAAEAPRAPLPQGFQQRVYRTPADLDAAMHAIARTDGPQGIFLVADDLDALWDAFRARFVFVQAAGGVVRDERGRLLAIRRLGKWDLPKGKVDPGEAIDGAALREVREECGVQQLALVRPIAHTWHTYVRDGREHLKRTDWFLMQGSSADVLVPQAEEDIAEVAWLERATVEAMRAETYPSLRRVLDAWLTMDRPPGVSRPTP